MKWNERVQWVHIIIGILLMIFFRILKIARFFLYFLIEYKRIRIASKYLIEFSFLVLLFIICLVSLRRFYRFIFKSVWVVHKAHNYVDNDIQRNRSSVTASDVCRKWISKHRKTFIISVLPKAVSSIFQRLDSDSQESSFHQQKM